MRTLNFEKYIYLGLYPKYIFDGFITFPAMEKPKLFIQFSKVYEKIYKREKSQCEKFSLNFNNSRSRSFILINLNQKM